MQNFKADFLDKLVGFSLSLTYSVANCPIMHHFTQLLFDSCGLASILENVTLKNIIKANKVLKKLTEEVIDMFPKLSDSKGIYL